MRGAVIAGFFLLPPVAFTSQELVERLLRAEAFGFDPALEPRLLIGLLVQLPAAIAALAVAWLLLRVVTRIARALRRAAERRLPAGSPASPWPTLWTPIPIARLALGYPQRGPPRPRSLRA